MVRAAEIAKELAVVNLKQYSLGLVGWLQNGRDHEKSAKWKE